MSLKSIVGVFPADINGLIWTEPLDEKQINEAQKITDIAATVSTPFDDGAFCQKYLNQMVDIQTKNGLIVTRIQAMHVQIERMERELLRVSVPVGGMQKNGGQGVDVGGGQVTETS